MKTQYFSNLKDNVASAAVLAAVVFAIVGTIVNSKDAGAAQPVMAVQGLDKVVVTAQRMQVVHMDAIVVVAPR